MQNWSDKQLWNAFRAGDDTAFAMLYSAHYNALFRYGRKFTTDEELVRDSIQDMFLKLHKYRQSLSDTTSIRFYLLASLRKVIATNISLQNRQQLFIPNPAELNFDLEFSVEEAIIQEQTTHEHAERLRKAMVQLTKRQKEAIYLKFYGELSTPEIAEVMGLRYQSVVNLIHEAIRSLSQHIRQAIDHRLNMLLLPLPTGWLRFLYGNRQS